jgi:hypothetical protein
MDRARVWGNFCANPPGTTTSAMFLVGGNPVAQVAYVQPNVTRCVTNLAECDAYPTWVGIFGDDWAGSYVDPSRCMARPKEWSDFCHNRSGAVVQSVFDGPGAHLEGGYAAP